MTRGWKSLPCCCAILAVLLVVGCAGWNHTTIPAAPSPVTSSPPRVLWAGVGRADITPPPGPGLAGYGPEGKPSTGYRVRLKARALVLEDHRGERIGFVVADLASLSPILHRLVAERVREQTGIGADRLIISATHTHSGPSHHYGERAYNENSAAINGYDPALLEFLVTRLTSAILQADSAMRPARLAWGQMPVWGHTRNRSYGAFLRNDPAPRPPYPPPPGIDSVLAAVDPTWTMIRVDVEGPGGEFRPAGGMSIFAIHGTGNTGANDLFDADIHGLVAQGIERHIERLSGREPAFAPAAVHLFANGAEGDVSPAWPEVSRCAPPHLTPARRVGGPRSPETWEWREPSPTDLARCQAAARSYVDRVSDSLVVRAVALFDSLGGRLRDDVTITRSFRVIPLQGPGAPGGLCEKPRIGSSTIAGAEDGRTRFSGWRLLGLFKVGLEEGGSAVRAHPSGCHREKVIAFGDFFQGLFVGEHGYPSVAQVSVVRIDSLLIGIVPAEATTTAGLGFKRAITTGAQASGGPVAGVAILGLANGFLQYITTDQEYGAQTYEGGSTLYGPATARVMDSVLTVMAGDLGPAGAVSPGASAAPLDAYPGPTAQRFDPADPSSAGGIPRQVDRARCRGDALVIRWTGLDPGRFAPYRGQVMEIRDGGGSVLGWDDDPRLTVRLIKRRGKHRATWEVRWIRTSHPGPYRFILLPRAGLPGLEHEVGCS